MSIPGAASPLFIGAAVAEEAGFQIDRSLRFNSADSAYLDKDFSSAGNRKTFTFSCWVKRSGLTAENNILHAGNASWFRFENTDQIYIWHNGSTSVYTDAKFRDVSAWYHLVLSVDTTQSTASNRIKLYVNGTQQTLSGTQPSQNADLAWNNNVAHYIGRQQHNTSNMLNGYLTEVNFVDGTQLTATDFGEYDDNNVWQPKEYSGSYGTNGFYLKFADNSSASNLGTDSSGNSNTWTVNNLSLASGSGNDSLIDTPTNYTAASGNNNGGNYATLNPLDRKSTVSLSNGNLDATTSSTGWAGVKGTMGVSSGKYYFEATANGSAANKVFFGICASSVKPDTSGYLQDDTTERAKGMLIFCDNGQYQLDGNSRVSYSSSMADGDVIAVAYDLDGNTVQFYKNGSALGSIDISGSPLASTTVVPLYIHYNTNTTYHLNFGQRPFAYTPPSNYLALVTTNLSDPTIADGSTGFDTKLWQGTGVAKSITGYNFSPDLVWGKARSATNTHWLMDTVRGAGKRLVSADTRAEDTPSGVLTSFNSDGFSIGTNTESNNSDGTTYVGWAWDAGTSTVSNTDGSITSNVRANPSAGFSIVSYNSGSSSGNYTLGHGLNAAPKFIIHKTRSSGNWWVYHESVVDNMAKYLQLNSTNALATNSAAMWGAAAPTSSVFGVRVGDLISTSQDAIAYCFTPVAGYSAIGSYEGNGSDDGPFVYTGFRVAWLMIKNTSTSGETWTIYDSTRDVDNPAKQRLQPNSADAESVGSSARFKDLLSNGFKIRGTSGEQNTSGDTYIYAAFSDKAFSLNGGLAR